MGDHRHCLDQAPEVIFSTRVITSSALISICEKGKQVLDSLAAMKRKDVVSYVITSNAVISACATNSYDEPFRSLRT